MAPRTAAMDTFRRVSEGRCYEKGNIATTSENKSHCCGCGGWGNYKGEKLHSDSNKCNGPTSSVHKYINL